MSLPRYVVLKSKYSNQYLRYVHEDVQVHGFVQFSGAEAVSPYTKFEVERAKKEDGLVHLRCCYNNKYLTRWSESQWWIAAAANEPEEDQTKWSCTLFKPVFADHAPDTVRLMHVQLGHYACLRRVGPPLADCLFAGTSNIHQDEYDVCVFVDWDSLPLLPANVAFQDQKQGKFLSAATIDGKNYLQLTDAGEQNPVTFNQTFTGRIPGYLRIKSVLFNKFWRRNVDDWIYADSDGTGKDNDQDLLFWPKKIGKGPDTVALLNMGNSKYCIPVTGYRDMVVDCLRASCPTDDDVETHWTVHDITSSRHIHNVNFRLLDARTYDQSVVVMASGVAVNKNKTQVDNMAEVKLSYTDKKTTTWDATASLKLGVKTTIKAAIPLIIAQGNIELSTDEFNGEYKWGATEEHTTVVDTVYKVTVPPMTTVTVTLLATKASRDVPFSYTQRDLLTNGHQVSRDMDDGVYTSTNFYNFKYETKQTKL